MSRGSRVLIGIFAIVSVIVIWALAVATFSATVGGWPVLIQAIFYLVAGLAWIFPLRPLVRWIQSGRFSRPSPTGHSSQG